ncbi:MAG TPA: FAD-binding oxidoreductase [Chitinophagaceae bacterium]|nr:FAD-binding oxidoreductase [Chitinophagaceae bacterium]
MQVSLWEQESFLKPADVLIVGAGFAGLWAALELKRKKKRLEITVIDRGIIPTGASTRNAGFSCFGSTTELLYDAKTFGEEQMLTLATLRYKGLLHIRENFKPKTIDYHEWGGYELFTENGKYDLSALTSDLKKLNKALKHDFKTNELFRLSDKKIEQFGFKGVAHLVENKLEGQLHSGKLTEALVNEVRQQGVRVLFGFEATGFDKINDRVVVHSTRGIDLSAKQLIICTNAFTNTLIPQLQVKPARGQVLVTSPINGLRFKGCFHYDEGFVYFRNIDNRVLLGGARNKFFEQEYTEELTTTDNLQHELEKLLREVILPGEKDYSVDYRWSGIMGMGQDKMPIVKELQPRVFCAVAMGGIGVAMAPIVARQVTRLMLGS